jgi:hypothetical protein
MAVRAPTLYLLCGSASTSKSVLIESIKDEFGVEVISIDGVNARRGYALGDPRIDDSVRTASVEVVLFEIITAGMSGQSLAIDDSLGNQSVTDKYIANAKGAGMKVELLMQPENS